MSVFSPRKKGYCILANCSLCGAKVTLCFSTGSVYLSLSAEVCVILQVFCLSRQRHQDCLFSSLILISDSRCLCHVFLISVLLSISQFLAYLTGTPFFRPSLPLGYIRSLDTHFFRTTTRQMNWPGAMRYSSHLLFHVVSLLLPLVSTLIFCRNEITLYHQTCLTYRSPQYSLGNLCFIVTLVVFSLVFARTDTVFC